MDARNKIKTSLVQISVSIPMAVSLRLTLDKRTLLSSSKKTRLVWLGFRHRFRSRSFERGLRYEEMHACEPAEAATRSKASS
jgi:hypothetical protein